MKIKSKLIANVLFKLFIVLAILLTGLFSIGFLQEKISYLTHQSTPLQIHIIELQRELQSAYNALLKVENAQNLQDFTLAKIDAIEAVEKTRDPCEKLNHKSTKDKELQFQELTIIADQLFKAVENRIKSDQIVFDANKNIMQSINIVSDRLDEHNNYIHLLQTSNAKAFTASLNNTSTVAERLRDVEELRNHIRELQLITVGMQSIKNRSAVLIAKAKLNALIVRISKNAYYKTSPNVSSLTDNYATLLTDFAETVANTLQTDSPTALTKVEEQGKDLPYKLNDLFQILDQESMLARDELKIAATHQESRFAQLLKANESLKTSSELVELGLLATAKTGNLPTYKAIPLLEQETTTINRIFKNMGSKIALLGKSLLEMESGHELHLLRSVETAVKTMSDSINSETGVYNALKQKIEANRKTENAIEQLNSIVFNQILAAKQQLATAVKEQEDAVTQVDKQVMRSRYAILTMGITAIVIALFFSFWIYRSVVPPLGTVLAAIKAQKEQGREKAELAKAVASGDFDREVTVSPALQLKIDPEKRDEINNLLFAVQEMNCSQIMLDQALGNMTTALKTNHDEAAQRYKTQQGLHELDKILRANRNLERMAEQVLSYLAGFLDVAVGIIYIHNQAEKTLLPLSCHAVSGEIKASKSFTLGEGLPGQVAVARKAILLSPAPDGYLPLSSALGASNPLTIAILPVLHQDHLMGVLELGSFSSFTEQKMAFLQQALEAVAVSFTMAVFNKGQTSR